jgi:DNA-binding NarL/FixJ family response regulator
MKEARIMEGPERSQGIDDRAPQLRLFLVSDHPITLLGVRATLAEHDRLCVVGQSTRGAEALASIAELCPDMVVVDLSICADALQMVRDIQAAFVAVKVVVLTACEEPDHVEEMLAVGVSAYVLKRAPAFELLRAIGAAAEGGFYLDPLVAAVAVRLLRVGSVSARPELSQREAAVLRLIAHGHAVKEIAASLAVSVRTLETYRARAMKKLGLTSRVGIVNYARSHGWMSDSSVGAALVERRSTAR